ncbi:MAG TPA: hypothetical protein VGH87_18110 [Polyangiaceae bacterium]
MKCVDHQKSGWLDCVRSEPTCGCPPSQYFCGETAVAHGCSEALSILGPKIYCECGWSDCDDDVSNGCETDLTSNDNCGACGVESTSCSLDAPTAMKPEVLFPSGYEPQGLAVDDQNIYWMSDGVLTMAPKGGGATTVLARNESSWNASLALSNGHVYWPWLTGQIHRVPITGGPVEVLASGIGPIGSNIVAYGDTAFVIVARGATGELVDSLGHDLVSTGTDGSLAVQNDPLRRHEPGDVRSRGRDRRDDRVVGLRPFVIRDPNAHEWNLVDGGAAAVRLFSLVHRDGHHAVRRRRREPSGG